MFFPRSEATARSQILTAQAVTADVGLATAAQSGIHQWAGCSLTHSESDIHKVTAKQGSTLDVPITFLNIQNHEIPWISPKDWLEWIIKKGLWPRLSGASPNDYGMSRAMWSQFWDQFEKISPEFEIFSMPWVDRSRLAAFCLHGDEGRTLKRQGIMVTNLQSCLGLEFDSKRVRQLPGGQWQMKVNFMGSSLTHRFVSSTVPKKFYENNPEVFHELMERTALSLKDLFWEGVVDPVSQETFRVAVIAIKGDAPYLTKLGRFYRSYNTTVKRGDAQSAPKGVCHACLAGTVGYPSEEIATDKPKWLETCGVRVPWLTTPSVIKHLPHNRADPSTFFQADIWHVVHLGFGRSWIASVIGILLEVIPQPNLDAKWEFLTTQYREWCRAQRKQMHIGSITAHLMSYGDKTGTMGAWHKGALTTNFMAWLETIIQKVPCDQRNLLPSCLQATQCLNIVFSTLFRADAFLTEQQCEMISDRGLFFLRVYATMARAQHDQAKPWAFPLYPKLHVFHEIILRVRRDGQRVRTAANPLLFSCQIDEDAVGKSSRLSRRVDIRLAMLRTLQRYKIAAKAAFVGAGLLQ
eukprot:Skav201275  [mRNA]  locus=scaffold2058:149895:151631:+ [translate_table: standard]